MKMPVFMRMFTLVSLIPLSLLSLSSCDTENEVDENEDPSKNTTDIAVTGLVDTYGCTYADIGGYVNLNLLPLGGGISEIGVELEALDGDDSYFYNEISNALQGNAFSVSFDHLPPATKCKYRSFVTCGGLTYYGEYCNFTTKEVVMNNITSTGNATDITHNSAVLTSSVQTAQIDPRENVYVGMAFSTSKSILHPDSAFREWAMKMPLREVEGGMFSVSLDHLSDETTYYFVSFTNVGYIYKMSSIKEFTTRGVADCPDANHVHAVDLGLSVKWACCNVGASDPKGRGGYYAWGETEEKDDYSWATYKWCDGSYDTQTKYCTDSYYGTVDYKTVLDPEDDVAHVKWGGSWRMPTSDEIEELRDKCSWEFITVDDWRHLGYKVTGPNGNSIFLPLTGYRYGTTFDYDESAYYWSGTLDEYDSSHAYNLYFSASGSRLDYVRFVGHTVRPVTE